MTTLLGQYYDTFVNWTNSYLGLQFSGQIGYNLPTDMLANVARVNAPETETLSFGNNIDAFRQYVGPAHLAGKRVISIELGAAIQQTYSQTWTDLLKDAKRAFIAGVNQVVIHGAPYSHTYPNTTWPGFTSFSYAFSGQHSRHQPAWDVGYAQAGEYLARTQFVLQSGIPKVDLVFWDKLTAQRGYPKPLYWPRDLAAAGYTYSYLSPDNFASDEAVVSNGVLAPGAQAFRALIVRANDTMTADGIQALAKYARVGLPILISGGVPGDQALFRQPEVPSYIAGDVPAAWNTNNSTAISHAQVVLQSILGLPNVHQVPYDSLAASIAAIGIFPRSMMSTETESWVTHWRENANGDIYVFLYNDGNHSTGSVAFETTMKPTLLDAWTGEESQVIAYSCNATHTTMNFTLAQTQTTIIRFSKVAGGGHVHVASAPAGSLIDSYAAAGRSRATARVISSGAAKGQIALSNGTVVPISSSTAMATSLGNWTLTVEAWNPPDDLMDVEMVANKTNVTFTLRGSELKAWSAISESLTNVSGVGYYSTSFTWPPTTGAADGAVLSLPPISHGVTASLNGRPLPAMDITHPVADISPYLIPGANVLCVKVASTLWNVLRPIWGQLSTGKSSPALPAQAFGDAQGYGLVGEVQVVPYVALTL
jgi:hypothetical protein